MITYTLEILIDGTWTFFAKDMSFETLMRIMEEETNVYDYRVIKSEVVMDTTLDPVKA